MHGNNKRNCLATLKSDFQWTVVKMQFQWMAHHNWSSKFGFCYSVATANQTKPYCYTVYASIEVRIPRRLLSDICICATKGYMVFELFCNCSGQKPITCSGPGPVPRDLSNWTGSLQILSNIKKLKNFTVPKHSRFSRTPRLVGEEALFSTVSKMVWAPG